jgi:hypothetical protein
MGLIADHALGVTAQNEVLQFHKHVARAEGEALRILQRSACSHHDSRCWDKRNRLRAGNNRSQIQDRGAGSGLGILCSVHA